VSRDMKTYKYNLNDREHGSGIVVGLTFLLFLSVGGASALSNDGGGIWTHSRDITISNPGDALSDYQILVSLSGAAFPAGAKADGADIRFTNSVGTELPFWIEEWNSSAQKAKVWVKVTSIPAGTSAVRVWWGNAGAGSGSSGDKTFEFFDDFESGNLSKYLIEQGQFINSNGKLIGYSPRISIIILHNIALNNFIANRMLIALSSDGKTRLFDLAFDKPGHFLISESNQSIITQRDGINFRFWCIILK